MRGSEDYNVAVIDESDFSWVMMVGSGYFWLLEPSQSVVHHYWSPCDTWTPPLVSVMYTCSSSTELLLTQASAVHTDIRHSLEQGLHCAMENGRSSRYSKGDRSQIITSSESQKSQCSNNHLRQKRPHSLQAAENGCWTYVVEPSQRAWGCGYRSPALPAVHSEGFCGATRLQISLQEELLQSLSLWHSVFFSLLEHTKNNVCNLQHSSPSSP